MLRTAKTLCRICLRSDFDASDVIEEELEDFHDELCDYDASVFCVQHASLKFCPVCECLLRRFYNFRQKCKRANAILKACKKQNLKNLKELPSTLGIGTVKNQKVLCLGSDFNSKNLTPDVSVLVKTTRNIAKPTQSRPTYSEIILLPGPTDESSDGLASCVKDENAQDVLQNNEYSDENLISFVKEESGEDVLLINNTDSKMVEEYIDHEEVIIKHLGDEIECESDKNYIIIETEATKKSVKAEKPKKRRVKIEKRAAVNQSKDDTDDSDVDIIAKLCNSQPDNTSLLDRAQSLEMNEEDIKYAQKFKLIADRKTLKHVRRTLHLKNKIVALLEQGKFQDLEGNVTLNKETFLDMFKKMDKARLTQLGLFNPDSSADMPRLKRFLQILVKMFDPKYNEMFDIQYMLTREEKLAEFNARRHSEKYLKADYKCDICYKVFDAQALLDYHGKWHEESRPAACDICGMRFMTKRSLKKHCNGDHYSVYRCKLCPLVTWNFGAMANHYDYHSGVKHTCNICFTEFSHKSSLNTHRRTVHTHPTACPQCGRSFVSQHGLLHHVLRKHRETPVVDATVRCQQCACAFVSEDALRSHVRLTHQKRRAPNKSTCHYPGCGLTFLTRVILRKHKIEAGHEHPPPATDTQTPNTQRLKRPMARSAQSPGRKRSRNAVSPPPFKTCPICDMQIRNWCHQALYMHHKKAHPGVPYPSSLPHDILCDLCGMSFHARWMFLEHMNTHSGERPFACECGARFARRALLADHAARHFERAYQCRECGKRFNTNSNLSSHMRSHIGDRRYKCELCPKRFLHKCALNAHVRGVHMHIRRVKKSRLRV